MKQETNNEMDLLLRRLGRRDDASVSDTDHLDADELSAYTENALPALARARYTAHLAECLRCRELVVQLSSSIGVVAASEVVTVAEPSGWKGFLASLFSPMVMRYAVPALGLILVAAIGLVVVRNKQSANYVTQVTNQAPQNTQPEQLVRPEGGFAAPDSISPTPGVRGNVEQQDKTQTKQNEASLPNAPPAASVDAKVSKDAGPEKPKPDQQTASAQEPPPQPAAPAPSDETRQTAEKAVNKKEFRGQVATTQSAESGIQVQSPRERKSDYAGRPAAASEPATGVVADRERDDLSASTRTVAGRRFQKKGGIWIDTAYNSSQGITTLTRGSEQYRAVVADEPAIKTIADELDGEILVVWKGRTYRIR